MGILLYQCIVGHTPFEGPRHEILEQQLKTKLPLSAVHNKQLRKIIAKACEKKQDLRYQTSAQMRVDLEAVTWTAKKSVSPKGPSKPVDKRIIGIVAGAVAALALIGVGIHFMMANPQTEPEITAAVQNEQVAVPQAEPTVEPEATATPEPKEEPKEEPKVEPKQEPKAEPKPEPKVEPKAQPKVEPKAEPKPEPKAEPKVAKGNLRYGSWSGKVSGGKPIGFGTLTFTSSATIRCSNGGSINAQAGDKINNAEFDDDGHLYQGTWIKADGTKKTIMP
jgi:serine/threonine protein kinase